MEIGNKSFKSVAEYKYLVAAQTNQNCNRDEIKSNLNSGNAGLPSVHSLLTSRMVYKNIYDEIDTNIILSVVFCVVVKLGFSH